MEPSNIELIEKVLLGLGKKDKSSFYREGSED